MIAGFNHTLRFNIQNANPLVQASEIIWLRDDDEISNCRGSVTVTVINGTTFEFSEDCQSLKLVNITYNITGVIAFLASNVVGGSGSFVNLTVHGRYSILLNEKLHPCSYVHVHLQYSSKVICTFIAVCLTTK